MLCGLIMAGGKGVRFWPLSTKEKPKQFLKLISNRTMIQTTVDRISKIIPMERIFVCTSKNYLELVEEQLPELPKRNIKDASEFINDYRDGIITLGMTPNRPETGYGYIKKLNKPVQINNSEVYKVERFVEKPNLATAIEYLAEGSYL